MENPKAEGSAENKRRTQSRADESTVLSWIISFVIASVVVGGIMVVGGVWTVFDHPLRSPSLTGAVTPQERGIMVRYLVSGRGSVSLTYRNQTGGTDQIRVSLPWQLQFKAQEGAFLYVSAQKQQASGSITATIEVNGVEVQRAKADAEYGIASVSGRL